MRSIYYICSLDGAVIPFTPMPLASDPGGPPRDCPDHEGARLVELPPDETDALSLVVDEVGQTAERMFHIHQVGGAWYAVLGPQVAAVQLAPSKTQAEEASAALKQPLGKGTSPASAALAAVAASVQKVQDREVLELGDLFEKGAVGAHWGVPAEDLDDWLLRVWTGYNEPPLVFVGMPPALLADAVDALQAS